eukprot:CAMPEP_0197866830 /NCGR_PEP_ID=MMETSP1438-20131217/44429_1 /TAXON_ID=1461541 /ORGANISM="Pterosperma sp., Strain CCMP1384" /LENGTH=482 /DNA_ID=CAMNT_0043485433 /DNA_START=208 /DNA_END=1656 /DNA_ORIENTATION=-
MLSGCQSPRLGTHDYRLGLRSSGLGSLRHWQPTVFVSEHAKRKELRRFILRASAKQTNSEDDDKNKAPTSLADWLRGTLTGARKGSDVAELQKRALEAVTPVLTKEELAARSWPNWFCLPLSHIGSAGLSIRPTVLNEVVEGQVWSLEQPFGAANIVVNIRMTLVKLRGGGLWIHSSIPVTPECLQLVQAITEVHGPVRYIVLPTYAVEHKVGIGELSRAFPEAEVWVPRRIWSYPINIDVLQSWGPLAVTPGTLRVLDDDVDPPWGREQIDFHILELPLKGAGGPFIEVAFYHSESRLLLVSDTLVCPPSTPPPCTLLDPSPLLLTERLDGEVELRTGPDAVINGWKKNALLALYLRPDAVQVEADGSFSWSGWEEAFDAIEHQVFVPPILANLILNRYPQKVLEWADRVGRWEFTHVLAAHFEGMTSITPEEFVEVFSFLRETNSGEHSRSNISVDSDQLTLLKQIDKFLSESGLAESKR